MTARENVVDEEQLAQELDTEVSLLLSHADTVPGATGRPRALTLREDAAFRSLSSFVADARAALAGREWDNLAHVEAFSRALRFCADGTAFDAPLVQQGAAPLETAPQEAALLTRFVDDIERRRIAELLHGLLPAAAAARAFSALPDDVAVRADVGFQLARGDLPAIAPLLSAHLAEEDLVARALVPGARVLAPKAACPFAARGTALWLVVDEVVADSDGAGDALVRGRAVLPDGSLVDVRRGPDGAPLRAVDGREQRIELKRSQLEAFLLGAGPDARGLDLRFSDDRCLLLVYGALLRERGLHDRLVHVDGTRRDDRIALVRACVRAAHDAVAHFTLDPLACAIALVQHDGDQGWPQRAWDMLAATGVVRDATPRQPRTGFSRTGVWLDAVLPPGYAAGRLSSVAAGRAFARLVTSVLAPLGVLPCSGHKDGTGSVLLQTILPPRPLRDDEAAAPSEEILGPVELASFGVTPRLEPLEDAWRQQRGLALPEPRNHPQHDLPAMPTWIAFFLEAVDPHTRTTTEGDALFEEPFDEEGR